MISGNFYVLVFIKGRTGENVISEFRDLIGFIAVEEVKEVKFERWGVIKCRNFFGIRKLELFDYDDDDDGVIDYIK